MAIPQYDLYGDPETWQSNIRQAEQGAWMRTKDVQPLLDVFVSMGGVIPDLMYPEVDVSGSKPLAPSSESQPASQTVSQTVYTKLPDYCFPTIDMEETHAEPAEGPNDTALAQFYTPDLVEPVSDSDDD